MGRDGWIADSYYDAVRDFGTAYVDDVRARWPGGAH